MSIVAKRQCGIHSVESTVKHKPPYELSHSRTHTLTDLLDRRLSGGKVCAVGRGQNPLRCDERAWNSE